jgi:hypothetical protein
VYKGGRNLADGSILSTLCLSALALLKLSAAFLPPLAAMVSILPRSRFRVSVDLVVLRRVLGWHALGYDNWLRCSVPSLSNLRPREFVFFACYAAAGLMPLISSFLLTLLEFYGIHLQNLSPHSFILVAFFVHFCEMFVRVQPSIPPLPVVPHTALGHEGDETDRQLLLPALSQGTDCLCCGG